MKDSMVLRSAQHPMSLDGYYVEELSFALKRDNLGDSEIAICTGIQPQLRTALTESPDVPIFLQYETSDHKELENTFRSSLTVQSDEDDEKSEKTFYSFKIRVTGFFSIDYPNGQTDELEVAFQTNAVMILYSIVRELLSSATSRSAAPGIILPTLQFKFFEEDNQPKKVIAKKKVKSKKKMVAKKVINA